MEEMERKNVEQVSLALTPVDLVINSISKSTLVWLSTQFWTYQRFSNGLDDLRLLAERARSAIEMHLNFIIPMI